MFGHLKKALPETYKFVRLFNSLRKRDINDRIVRPMARLLYLLASDQALSTVVPFRCHSLIEEICQTIQQDSVAVAGKIKKLRDYCRELAVLFTLSARHDFLGTIVDFAKFLVFRVVDIHKDDPPAAPANPIPGSYDPSKGVAYYFTQGGLQVRKMPNMDFAECQMYDDAPTPGEACKKLYPQVSHGGFGYIFLWFCPLHGHTYGFHCIQGGEGKRDPFCSLWKYMETPPKEIFYDNACQFNEFWLNRAPALFKNTRSWHDLFHSEPHKCGNNFKSGRVDSLEGINTEICEQTNSYLQCLKYTCSHMSMVHMMQFLQFFLYLHNCEKTKRFQHQASIALAGTL